MAAKQAKKRVRPKEIAGLLRELRRLMELGSAASFDEWYAYHCRKDDILERLAARPEELVDIDEATLTPDDEASAEVDSPRAHRTSTMAPGSAPPTASSGGWG